MKKLFTFLFLASAAAVHAGTNASLAFRTNDWQIVPPGVLASNAAAIASALNGIGFSGSTNTNAVFFLPSQFNTNGSGQVQATNIPAAILSGTIAALNLSTPVATLASNIVPAVVTSAITAATSNLVANRGQVNYILPTAAPTAPLFWLNALTCTNPIGTRVSSNAFFTNSAGTGRSTRSLGQTALRQFASTAWTPSFQHLLEAL